MTSSASTWADVTSDNGAEAVTWEATPVVEKLRRLDGPDEAAFCTSGRAANETAFLYQLFVRGLGTNNLPDCSSMCHESTGWAMGVLLLLRGNIGRPPACSSSWWRTP